MGSHKGLKSYKDLTFPFDDYDFLDGLIQPEVL